MATLYITEYSQPAIFNGQVVNLGAEPSTTDQTVAIGAAAQSSAFKNNTTLVRLHSDAICSVLFGTSPSGTVSTSNRRMAANQTEYFSISPSSGLKVGVISNT